MKGFTLLEVLIVIGLFSIIGAFVLFVDMSNVFGSSFHSEERTIVTLLQTTRMNAMNNIGDMPHGLALHPVGHEEAYVLFAGPSYQSVPSSHVVVPVSYPLEIEGTSFEIIFNQHSGMSDVAHTLLLKDPYRPVQAEITIHHEGTIDW